MLDLQNYVNDEVLNKFEFKNYGHALEILSQSYTEEWDDIKNCLSRLKIFVDDIKKSGGNETPIPKKFDDILYPAGWREIRISGDLILKLYPRQVTQRRGKFSSEPFDKKIIEGYIDGHNIDFVKNKVAFDLEWNSKDQTFDRDLLAMRTYFDCGIIDVGIIITRAQELNDIFNSVNDSSGNKLIKKYGASTTWMGKLEPRLKSRRNGGCPILAIGIKKACIVDWRN